jgi:hypothetical protein
MLSSSAQVKRVLDENLYLLQVLNLDFKENPHFEVDPAFNPSLEPNPDPLAVGLRPASQAGGYRQQHFVD